MAFFLLVFAAVSDDPEFTDVIENITVPAGRSVKLACSVKNLGNYKVNTGEYKMKQVRNETRKLFELGAVSYQSEVLDIRNSIL